MDGFSGLYKWVGKMSDEWLCPPSPPSTLSPQSPLVRNDTSELTISGEAKIEELGSSLSPLHSSREILAGYTDFTCNCHYKIDARRKSRPSKLSYSTLPLAADEME